MSTIITSEMVWQINYATLLSYSQTLYVEIAPVIIWLDYMTVFYLWKVWSCKIASYACNVQTCINHYIINYIIYYQRSVEFFFHFFRCVGVIKNLQSNHHVYCTKMFYLSILMFIFKHTSIRFVSIGVLIVCIIMKI